MNFKLKTSLIIGAIVASSLVYAATVLSPNQNNNSGSIPSGYSDLEFNLGSVENYRELIKLAHN